MPFLLRTMSAILSLMCLGSAWGKLPPPTEEARAKSAEAATKAAWTDKVGAYQLCLAMDRTATAYRRKAAAEGKITAAPSPTPPCSDPGPYASTSAPEGPKPLEASGAHSPPGTAVSPPGSSKSASELAGGARK
jgi:hypothetical protein